ncbi:MAG: HAD family hydrolase [Phycisphaerae bacterium]
MNIRYPAVIFDLDGTLADTLKDLADATNWGLAKLGQPQHRLDNYRYLVGTGRTELCRKALPENRQDLVEQLIVLMTDYYAKHCFDTTLPYPGIEDLLNNLSAQNIKLAVLSNKPQNFVELTLERLFGRFRFSAVVGDCDDKPRKPDPTGALSIAKALKLPPQQIAYVGDTSTDMQTANRAKMFAIGVSWGFRERQELIDHGANVIVDTPDALYRVLTGLQ